jgi:hypothetical protein
LHLKPFPNSHEMVHTYLRISSLVFVLECVVGLLVVLVFYECCEVGLADALFEEFALLGWGEVGYVVVFGFWFVHGAHFLGVWV